MTMNIEQQQAIEASFDQPLCILAGPGSGKTRTLVERVVYLVRKLSTKNDNQLGLQQSQYHTGFHAMKNPFDSCILLLTFSRSAVHELKRRFLQYLYPSELEMIDIHTFHSFSYRVIRINYLLLNFTAAPKVCGYKVGKDILKKLVDKLRNPVFLNDKQHNMVINRIYCTFLDLKSRYASKIIRLGDSAISSLFVNNELWIKCIYRDNPDPVIQTWSTRIDYLSLCLAFIHRVKELNYLHYDDMVPLALSLIQPSSHPSSHISSHPSSHVSSHPSYHASSHISPHAPSPHQNSVVLSVIQSRYKYFFCDEFQDTNKQQLELLFRIASSGKVSVVGDTNQCIYGFQGAEYVNLERFITYYNQHAELQRDGRQVNIVTLRVNYRSHDDIIATYNAVIQGRMMSNRAYQQQLLSSSSSSSSMISSSSMVSSSSSSSSISSSSNPRHRVYLTQCRGLTAQFDYICNAISILLNPLKNHDPRIRGKPLKLSDVAILYRKNEFGAAFKKYLVDRYDLPKHHQQSHHPSHQQHHHQHHQQHHPSTPDPHSFHLSADHFRLTKNPIKSPLHDDRFDIFDDDDNGLSLLSIADQHLQRLYHTMTIMLALYQSSQQHVHPHQGATHHHMDLAGLSEEIIMQAIPSSIESSESTIDAMNSARKLMMQHPSSSSSSSSTSSSFFNTLYQVIFKGATPDVYALTSTAGFDDTILGAKRKLSSSLSSSSSSCMISSQYYVTRAQGLKNWMTSLLKLHEMIILQIRDFPGIIAKIIDIALPERKSSIISSSSSFSQHHHSSDMTPDDPIHDILQRAKMHHLLQPQSSSSSSSLYDQLQSFSHFVYDIIQQRKTKPSSSSSSSQSNPNIHESQSDSDDDDDDDDTNISSSGNMKDNRIWLGTIHRSKGLEWEVVFVVNANDDEFTSYDDNHHHHDIDDDDDDSILPSINQSSSTVSYNEAQRLLYVALSRAKDELHISYLHSNPHHQNPIQVKMMMMVGDHDGDVISRYLSGVNTLPSKIIRRLVYPPPNKTT